MTDAADKQPTDPDAVRMSFGEHLEELRKRLIWAIFGLVAATVLCFHFGDKLITILTTPYMVAMNEIGQEARLVQLNPLESFMEYFKISLEFGLVVAAPWILYQLWLFIAAGLYPNERKIVTYFAPASIGLFLLGASFLVLVVLSGLIKFLIGIAGWFPLPDPNAGLYAWMRGDGEIVATQPADVRMNIPVATVEPNEPVDGQIWLDPRTRRLNVYHDGETYYLPMQKASAKQIVQPFFSVAEYLGFVTNLALAFGLGFQVPIVVVFLIAMRIVTSVQMRSARRFVVLAVLVASAVITPTPDIGTMLMLAVPMLVLFEAGLMVGRVIERRQAAEAA